ncbi:enoyl-CoA hydratase/isomerase family protein [Pusillimonas sp. TS35]|nr:enoyl-CoA hydratase/isomerase family protein [Pusillimonas sp. TS35]
MLQEILKTERHAGVVRLTLRRPERGNSLSPDLVDMLAEQVRISYQDGTRLLVLEAEGKHFCTGFDLSDLDAVTDDDLLARFARIELLLQALHAAPFTVVAIGHGRIMGAGADLFLACEQRWIKGDASFCFPGAAFGLVLGTRRLASIVGTARARAWVRSGSLISEAQAHEAGMFTDRVDHAEIDIRIEQLAAESSRLSLNTHAAVQRATRSTADELNADLCALLKSAAEPGLKSRIEAYRQASRK